MIISLNWSEQYIWVNGVLLSELLKEIVMRNSTIKKLSDNNIQLDQLSSITHIELLKLPKFGVVSIRDIHEYMGLTGGNLSLEKTVRVESGYLEEEAALLEMLIDDIYHLGLGLRKETARQLGVVKRMSPELFPESEL